MTPTAGNDGPICAGQILHLTATDIPGAAYSWTGPNGFNSLAQNPSIANATTAASGPYTVTATVGTCVTSGSTNATVKPLPNATITADAAVCALSAGNAASVAGGRDTYAWTITNGTITSASNTASITYTASSISP